MSQLHSAQCHVTISITIGKEFRGHRRCNFSHCAHAKNAVVVEELISLSANTCKHWKLRTSLGGIRNMPITKEVAVRPRDENYNYMYHKVLWQQSYTYAGVAGKPLYW